MKTIFVSSTFRDMQQERDVLQRLTLPAINAQAKLYGESVSFCDLRWGVNTANLTEEQSNSKVLNVCLDVIDRCEPIMIVILGERYGWIPGNDKILQASQRKNMQLEDYEISVTALEIEYGSIYRKAKTLVYCRNFEGQNDDAFLAEDDAHAQKLALLKKRLEPFAYGGIRSYTLHACGDKTGGLEDFARMVQEDVTKLLLEQWKNQQSLSEFGKNLLINQGLFAECGRSFLAGIDCKNTIVQTVKKGAKVVNVYGKAGCGKSTLMGALYEEFTQLGYKVLPLQVGSTAQLSTNAGALNYVVDYFKECHEILPYDQYEDQDENAFDQTMDEVSLSDIYRTFLNSQQLSGKIQALAECAEQFDELGKRLVVLVDGVDNFHDDLGEIANCYIPENLNELANVTYVITSNQPRGLYGEKQIAMPTLDEGEMTNVLCVILAKNHRELDVEVVQEILQKCRGREPLYLKLILQRLLMMDARDFAVMSNMSAITAHQLELVQNSSQSLQEVGYQVLCEGACRINANFLLQTLDYVALSCEGLTEAELMALMPNAFDKGDFYGFFAYMSDLFILRHNGRYDFANVTLKQGFAKKVQNAKQKARRVVDLLCDKFFQTEVLQPKPDYSILQEIAYLCLGNCDDYTFVDVASKFLQFDEMLAQQNYPTAFDGSKYALQVFAMTFEQNHQAVLHTVQRLAKSYPNATEERKQQILQILRLYYDTKPSGYEGFSKQYLDILTTKQNCQNVHGDIANVCLDLFAQADIDGDKNALATYAQEALDHLMQYLANLGEDADLFSEIIDSLSKIERICNVQFNNPTAVEKVGEHLNYYQNYLSNLLTQNSQFLDENEIAFLGGQVLRIMYYNCKLLDNNDNDQMALTAYLVLVGTYQNVPESFTEGFHNFVSATKGDLFQKLAKLCKRVGKQTNEEDFLLTALEYFNQAQEANADDDTQSDADTAEYLAEIAEIYQLLGDDYLEEYRDCLQQTLELNEQSLYLLGYKLNACLGLYNLTQDVYYAQLVVNYAHELLTLREELYPDMTSTKVIDLTAFADDFDQMKIFINDGAYLSKKFAEDVNKAITLCQAFDDEDFAQAKIILAQGLQQFDE